jgi:ATP-dependent Clp protease ATP-binding subunit ClpA
VHSETKDETRLGGELRAVVAGARRRAARDGDHRIDTAHLLHSLLETDPRAREALGEARLVRVLGYLVQRSIGYGIRWRGSVESPSAADVIDAAAARARGRGVALPNGTDLLAALATDPSSRAAEVLRRARVDPRLLLAALPDQRLPERHPAEQCDVSCYRGDGAVAS